jgi:hypothetical protein
MPQEEIDKLLRRGILFSFLWLAGFGSLYAFMCGVKARRFVKESGGALYGGARIWWCLVVGAAGMMIWFPIILIGVMNNVH